MINALKDIDIAQILGYYAAGQSKQTSDIIDTAGYEGVLFLFELGQLINAGTVDCFVEGNSINSTVGMARLAGQTVYTVTVASATPVKSVIAVDVFQPDPATCRYLQANITPAGSQNAVILGITAIKYRGKYKPEVNSNVLKATQLVSPATV